MSIVRSLSNTWRNLIRRASVESDLDAELRAYVDLSAGQKMKSGMSPAEARRAALIESDGVEQVKERVRDVRAGNLLETVLRDVRFGARMLARNPAFTAAAVTMLALGIGANTAVFSVVNTVLLRGLPYSQPDRIVALYEMRPREHDLRGSVSPPDFLDWRDQSASFQNMAAIAHTGVTWQSDAGAERVLAGVVSPEFFDVVGIRPALGSGFRKEKEIQGSYRAVVLTHGFWQRRFGADPTLLGRTLTINGNPAEVVGILPASFEYPVHDVELFVPLWWRTRDKLDRASHELTVAGRLKPGVSIRAAQAEMDAIAGRLEQQYPAVNKGHSVNLVSMRDVLLGPVELPLMALQAAVAFVLIIACGNLANLLLARTLARRPELSVRLAIGAGRGRLIRQLLSESVLLATIGEAAGIALAYFAVPLLRSLVPEQIPVLGIRNVQVDGTVLILCLLLAILCGIVFGLVPALRGSAAGIAVGLKEGTDGGPRGERLRKTLVAAQIALSVVLLTGAGMFLRSFAALGSVDPGFRSAGGAYCAGGDSLQPLQGAGAGASLHLGMDGGYTPPARGGIRWPDLAPAGQRNGRSHRSGDRGCRPLGSYSAAPRPYTLGHSRILPGHGHENRAGPALRRNRSRRQPVRHDRQRGGGPQIFSARQSARPPGAPRRRDCSLERSGRSRGQRPPPGPGRGTEAGAVLLSPPGANLVDEPGDPRQRRSPGAGEPLDSPAVAPPGSL